MRKTDLNKMKEEFEDYIMWMSDELVELEKMASNILQKNEVLDYSKESLDFLETVLLKKIEDQNLGNLTLGKLKEVISSYMGEIARKQLNGKWELCIDRTDFDFGLPMVTKLDGLPVEFGWCPIQAIFNFSSSKKKGALKRALNSVIDK